MFGITPAFAEGYSGARHVGAIFGFMMLVWAFPVGFGPLLFVWMREATGGYTHAFYLIAGTSAVGTILPLVVSRPLRNRFAAEPAVEAAAGGSVALSA